MAHIDRISWCKSSSSRARCLVIQKSPRSKVQGPRSMRKPRDRAPFRLWTLDFGPWTYFLAEPSRDVILGLLLAGPREDFRSRVDLDQVTVIEERGAIADAGGLLHVMRDNHDRVVLLELEDQVLNVRGRCRI